MNSTRAARWAAVLVPGVVIYFTPFEGLTDSQRHLLAVFVATIISLVAQPVGMGITALSSMTVLTVTKTLEPAAVFAGFGEPTVWLIFCAFLFARAVTVTQLGLRVAYIFIRQFGRSPLSLGYSIAGAGLALAPFVPSDTARGGGVMFPIARSVAQSMGSEPGETAAKIGRYLMLVGFHMNYAASAMFLTSMAANPLIASFALKGANVDMTWGTWATGTIVPGFFTFMTIPWVISRMHPPEMTDTQAARTMADDKLAERGPMSRNEKLLALVFLLVMVGWVTQPMHKLHNAVIALAGITVILVMGVITWDDLLTEKRAWDALIWFAPLLMMAAELNKSGVIGVLTKSFFGGLTGISWPATMLLLVVMYVYLHYAFASLTAHVTALYPGFLAAALASGAPPLLAAMPLAYFSSLNAGITHYGTGSAPVFFGAGYVTQGTWWRTGLVVSIVNLSIWLTIGVAWWKVIGWW